MEPALLCVVQLMAFYFLLSAFCDMCLWTLAAPEGRLSFRRAFDGDGGHLDNHEKGWNGAGSIISFFARTTMFCHASVLASPLPNCLSLSQCLGPYLVPARQTWRQMASILMDGAHQCSHGGEALG